MMRWTAALDNPMGCSELEWSFSAVLCWAKVARSSHFHITHWEDAAPRRTVALRKAGVCS